MNPRYRRVSSNLIWLSRFEVVPLEKMEIRTRSRPVKMKLIGSWTIWWSLGEVLIQTDPVPTESILGEMTYHKRPSDAGKQKVF